MKYSLSVLNSFQFKNPIRMPDNKFHYSNKEKVRIYRGAYRPSSNFSHFIKTLLSVILMGQSPLGSIHYRHLKNQTNNRH